ncbi:MAG: hypothetical protein K9I68_06820 [Bacteroidales bacterium]|nr:hypothetical protein [Bacteroidales bacterium]
MNDLPAFGGGLAGRRRWKVFAVPCPLFRVLKYTVKEIFPPVAQRKRIESPLKRAIGEIWKFT